MQRGQRIWIRGLLAAFVSGASNAVTASSFASMLAPESFNFEEGSPKLLALFVFTLIAGGVIGIANFLKQSPIPPDDELDVSIDIRTKGP